MAYLVLARKYRPQFFSDVAGQDHVTRTLLNALAQDRIAHGYIFSGHRGIGKTTIARILAMALNCRTPRGTAARPTPEPCGVCESCTEIRAGNAVDVIEIDAATNRGIDEIRELREAARYRPSRDRFKIYILDEAHQITDAAFNALLKTLEEPPEHVVFMMATTQPEDIPQTIRSRCQHFSFHAVAFDDIVAQLNKIAGEENITADSATLGLLAEAGDGSMRDALSIMDQAIASAPQDANGRPELAADQIRELMGTVPSAVFESLLEGVSAGSSADVLREANRLLNAGHSPQQLARQMVKYLRNTLMAKIAGEASDLLQISTDERARAGRTALLFGEEDLTRFLQVMLRAFDELGYRQEQRLHFELGLLKLVHAQRLLPLEEMLSSAAATPARATLPAAAAPQRPSPAAAQPGRIAAVPSRPPAAAPARPAASAPAEAPGFSPFESDRRRKDPFAHSAGPAVTASSTAPQQTSSAATVRQMPASAPAAAPMTSGALALAEEPETEAPPQRNTAQASVEQSVSKAPAEQHALPEALPDATPDPQPAAATAQEQQHAAEALPPGTASPNLDRLQQAVMQALHEANQSSAAETLASSVWTPSQDEWCIAVPCSAKMLGICMNADARRIAEGAARAIGASPARLTYQAAGAEAARPAAGGGTRMKIASGAVQAEALNHPLVKRAQELFNAEVRQVIEHKQR